MKNVKKIVIGFLIVFMAVCVYTAIPAGTCQAKAAKQNTMVERPGKVKLGKFVKTYDSRYDKRPNHGDGVTYTAKWNKARNASGYQVMKYEKSYSGEKWYGYSLNTKERKASFSFSSIYAFKMKVRAYRIVNGTKVYGPWSNTVSKVMGW